MKRTVLVLGLLGLAACPAKSGEGDDYAPIPGGNGQAGGSSGNRPNDGGIDAETGDAGTPISGRVCLLDDLIDLGVVSKCKNTGAANLTVTLGNRTATTAADGKFTIIAPAGGGLIWRVTGLGTSQSPAIVPSVVPYSTDTLLPAILDTDYLAMASQNGMELNVEQQGSAFVRVFKNGVAAKGVTATSTPAAIKTLYDGPNSVQWSESTVTGTSGAGIVWLPGVQVSQGGSVSATVSLQQTGSATVSRSSFGIEDQSITFQSVELQ